MSILVLGLGNIIMTDDGVGGRAVETLRARFTFPRGVRIEDGGTLGLDLLPMFEGVDRLLIIDALEMDAAPGTLLRLEGDEVPRALASKVSVHQMGIQDLLAVAELQGHLPQELVVWGVQPQTVEMGVELSLEVAATFEELLDGVLGELRGWGVEITPGEAVEV
ncbi:MAG: HyaD/HybD family hydrogenase maturation endopeptidase [Desulfuromonas sp.]|nr:MAG: HyaD/HybD family hydrogenase maturation endopeptidase [Desulfuromonas sp.]